MTITQTVDIPDSHRLTIDIPREIPAGRAVLAFTPAPVAENVHAPTELAMHPCPICNAHLDPVTGNPRYNAETVAAFEGEEEVSRRFKSVAEMFEDLDRDDPDDMDD